MSDTTNTAPAATGTVAAVVAAQRDWFLTGVTRERSFRLERLEALSAAIQRREPEILNALAADLGKGEFETFTTEIGILYDEIRHARRHLRRWMRPRRVSTPLVHAPARSRVVPRPLGVSAILSPWNYPFQLAVAPLLAAIAAGNCAVVKPSEHAPATSAVLERLIRETFDPRHVACVTGDAAVAAELTAAPVDHIFYTGSTAVGRKVMQAAAERLVPVTLELGGKSPAIVSANARVGVSARRLVWGKLLNAGQTCVAPDYVVAHRSVVEPLLEGIRSTLSEFFPYGIASTTEYGRIINDAHFSRLAALMDRQAERGAPVIGGERDPARRYIEPTVYAPAGWDDPLMEDELFGPLLPVIPYDDLDTVIGEIARRPNPLAAYLFSEDRTEKRRFESEVFAGGGTINDTILHLVNPELPFGGVGPSGLGSYHGHAGFRAFSHEASIMERGTWLDLKLKYPPYGTALGLIRRIMKP